MSTTLSIMGTVRKTSIPTIITHMTIISVCLSSAHAAGRLWNPPWSGGRIRKVCQVLESAPSKTLSKVWHGGCSGVSARGKGRKQDA